MTTTTRGAQRGNQNAAKPTGRVASIPARVSPEHVVFAQRLGYTSVRLLLDALVTGDAIALAVQMEYADQFAETISHINAAIDQHRHAWHPSATENTMRGVIAALETARDLYETYQQ